ncbi:hypothetical protein Gpo141_00012814 [Globisporangium polare]
MEQQQSILGLAISLATVRERFEELHRHENESHAFSQLCELLDDVEQRIFKHKDAFGVANAKFQLGCEEFVLLSSTVAMHMLQLACSPRDLKLCGELLQKAEQHTRRAGYLRSVQSLNEVDQDQDDEESHASRRLEFRLVCLNNLACYHKEVARPLAALGFLEKALKIQLKQVATGTGDHQQQTISHAIALTHLNLCAVLSQLQRHSAAAEHARSSITLLAAIQSPSESHSNDRIVQLALVAHFNLGVELEHLSDLDAALRTYQAALQLAKVHGITRNESNLVRTMEEIVKEPRYGRRSTRGTPAVSPRSRVLSQCHLRPLSPRSLRQTSTQLS